MKSITIKQWVDALRSGVYKQGKGALRPTSKTFCSIGVLCDLIDESRWTKHSGQYVWYNSKDNISFSTMMLPPSISVADNIKAIIKQATIQNDTGVSFDKIATFIEENSNPDDLITLNEI